MKSADKGVGTCGLWLAICVIISTLVNAGLLNTFGVALIMLGAFLTTSYIWIDDKAIAAIEKTFEEKERNKWKK